MKTCPRCGSALTKEQIESEKQTTRFAFVATVLLFLGITLWSTFSGVEVEPGSLVDHLRKLFGVAR